MADDLKEVPRGLRIATSTAARVEHGYRENARPTRAVLLQRRELGIVGYMLIAVTPPFLLVFAIIIRFSPHLDFEKVFLGVAAILLVLGAFVPFSFGMRIALNDRKVHVRQRLSLLRRCEARVDLDDCR